MNHFFTSLLLLSMMTLTACDALETNSTRLGDDAYDEYNKTREMVAGYIFTRPEDQPPAYRPYETPVFCYRTMMDTTCYDRPQPELHQRLVAVQGIHNYHYEDFLPETVLEQQGLTHEVSMDEPYVSSYQPESDQAVIAKELTQANTSPETGGPFHQSPSPSAIDALEEEQPSASAPVDNHPSVPLKLMPQ